jgi:imidazole glycerol-phosphate synthase subunit HisF
VTVSSPVVVVDAGVGNLGNLARALAHLGAEVTLTSEPSQVAAARCMVLPGVGAFGPPRERLRGALEGALREALEAGAWLLGICVGYQLLFEEGEEQGWYDGLGLLPGRVTRLPAIVPLPHMGWSPLRQLGSHPLLEGIEDGDLAYFVHGFAPEGLPSELWLAAARHGRTFPALAARGRVVGTQFHPEKSGQVGLRLLASFLRLAGLGAASPSRAEASSAPTGSASIREGLPRGPADRRGAACLPPGGGANPAGAASPSRAEASSGPTEVRPGEPDLFPAIDLRRGRVVRLERGEDARATIYGDDPGTVLDRFAAQGARWVHIVDLDAAFGEPAQRELLVSLLRRPERPAIQLGGGLRDQEAILAALELGCERVVVGSLVARDFPLFAELARSHPGRLVPALDIARETVRVEGWRREAAPWRDLASRLRGLPCPAVLVTDIERDGTLTGPNLELAREVAEVSGLPSLLSGGIRGSRDLRSAACCPLVAGVVVGKALYQNALTIEQALGALGSELTARVIPCLDIAEGRVVKGVRFQGLVDQGDPAEIARRYAAEGADEIVFLDVSATHQGRKARLDWVERVAREVFVPLAVGGGVTALEDARDLLLAGADKVALNSGAVARPELLEELAERLGRQCVVLSVDARRRPGGGWEVVTHGGRRPTVLDALEWIAEGVERGAGEILLTSMDGDGTQGGYDLELLAGAARRVRVPIVASGGAGAAEHLAEALDAGASAVLAASIFHQGTFTVGEVKNRLAELGHPVRLVTTGASPLASVGLAPSTGFGNGSPGSGAGTAGLQPGSPVGRGAAYSNQEVPEPRGPRRPAGPFLDLSTLSFEERGLLPVVVQDFASGAVLMLAWADREALERTLETRTAWFWSRSRQRLWQKGESSGNVFEVQEILADCDGDAVLLRVRPRGPACHRGTRSCFEPNVAALELGWLFRVLEERRHASPEESYTARLLSQGLQRVAQKVGEEAVETLVAALSSGDEAGRGALAEESADLLYHLLALLLAREVPPGEVARALADRHAAGGAGR